MICSSKVRVESQGLSSQFESLAASSSQCRVKLY